VACNPAGAVISWYLGLDPVSDRPFEDSIYYGNVFETIKTGLDGRD
jgi:hypothetical protein